MPGENQPALSAHDQAMVAKMDATAAAVQLQAGVKPPAGEAPPSAPQRPENVPEKFWDAEKGQVNTEALLKSYTELEAGKSKPPGEPPKEGEKSPEEAAKALADAKVNTEAMAAEYAKDGKLSDASYEALSKAGFGKDVVDAYIAGQEALAAQRDAQGYEMAGGQEKYTAMAQWAVANLPQAERDAFNEAVSGNPAQMKQAILGLKAQYEAAMGADPKLTKGGGGSNAPSGAFGSRQEVTAAMRDPRYKADPAYRADVERRIGLMDNF